MVKRTLDKTYANKSYKVKGKKAVAVRVIKKVKVSPKLKAKIMKVIDKKVLNITGTVTDHFLGGKLGAIDREQNVTSGCGSTRETSWHFTVPAFLDAAAVLFNNKTPTQSSIGKYRLGQPGGFNSKNIQFEVKDSHSTYTFKNNMQHQIVLKLVVCVPKRKGVCQEWSAGSLLGQTAEGGDRATADAFVDFKTAWQGALNTDVANGVTINGFSPHAQAITAPCIIQQPTTDDLFLLPTMSRTFNNLYATEIITLELLPGQTVNHRIQGPRNLNIDMAKMTVNEVVQSVQKFSRNVGTILYNSPNAIATVPDSGVLSNARTGRFADKVDSVFAGFDVHVECVDFFKIVMPEQTGFVVPAVGTVANLGFRRSRTNYNVYDVPASVLPALTNHQIVDLSVMNPQEPVRAGPGTGT